LSCEFCMIDIVINMNGKVKKTVIVYDIFINSSVIELMFGAGAFGARFGAASRYGSGSIKMMRRRLYTVNCVHIVEWGCVA
jgi:hypothetical protein